MSTSLSLVTLRVQQSRECVEKRALETTDIFQVHNYQHFSIFSNRHGIFKISKDDVAQIDGSPCLNFALSTGESRLLVSPIDEAQALLECDLGSSQLQPPLPSPLPPPLSCSVRLVACGAEHSLALLRHGVVMAWGRGPQLGLGAPTEDDPLGPTISEPQPVPGIRDAIFVAAGAHHSAVIAIGGSNSRGENYESSGEAASLSNSGRAAAEAGDQSDALRLKVQLGLSSFLFRATNCEWHREGGLLERLRGVRRWSVSVTSEETRPSSPLSSSSGPYDQCISGAKAHRKKLMCDREATPSSDSIASSDLRPESDLYCTLDENSIEEKSVPALSWLEEEMRSHVDELAVDTEVWTWGRGKAGQLGNGASEDVSKPTRLQNLPSVVKVSCGFSHCLALTADSKVYLWGTYQKAKCALVPQLVETGSDLIYDVAAGNCVSLMIGYITYRPDVFMLDKDRLPVRKTELRGVGWPVNLASTFASSQGDGHCLVSQPTSPDQDNLYEAFHELSFKLRSLFSHLHNLKLSFVDAFTHIFSFDDESPLSNRLILLFNSASMLHRTTHACVGVATRRCLATLDAPLPDPLEVTALERALSRQLDAFRFFAHTLSNAIAWNSFEMLFRQRTTESNEALSHFTHPLPAPAARPSAMRDAFTSVPVLMEMQHAQVERLAQLAPDFAAVVSENLAADNVTSIHRHAKENLSCAMETCALVESLPSAVQLRLATRPERRLVLDSQCCPLSVSNKSGRAGSSQRLLLFTDALVLVASSQVTVWPLTVMWVRSATESRDESDVKPADSSPEPNVHSLQVRTPDEEVRMYAQDETARARWFATINREINRSLVPRSTTATRPSMSQIAPERRYGQYTFRSGPYRYCRYDGQWSGGLMHGEGQLTWQDGCQHQGRFHRGRMLGHGRRETKNPSRVMEGHWEDGVLHGYGSVIYDEDGLKSQYTGWFCHGVREGHGVLRSGSDYLYIGEWTADKQHGYGVEENYSPTPYRFFGEWKHGLKHGCGSLVTLTNRFVEGHFVNGEMRGLGRIVDGDFVFTGQIFNEKPNGQGVVQFKTNSGAVRLTGQCFGAGERKLRFEGEVDWEELSPAEAQSANRNSVYSYQTENIDLKHLPSRWNAILLHCENDLGAAKDEEDDTTERRRARAWSALATHVLSAKRRWKKSGRKGLGLPESRSVREPRWGLLECIPASASRFTANYVSRARDYFMASAELLEHPLGLYVHTMVGLIKEAYLGMGTHPQLLRHAREDVWITANGLYKLLRRLFPLLPACLDQKTPLDAEEEQEEATGGEFFVGRNFVYDLLLPRVYACLRTLYATTLTVEEEAYRRTLRKFNRIADMELFTLLEIPGDIRERLAPEYDIVGEKGRTQQTFRYLPVVERLRTLNYDDVSCPLEQLTILMDSYDDMLKMIADSDTEPSTSSADIQLPVMLFLLVRANITHLGTILAYIRDMDVFPLHCDRGALMYKFTTVLGLYRHLVDRNGALH